MFGRKSFLSREREDWHIDTWIWLYKHGQYDKPLSERPLVLPKKPFFEPIKEKGHERAIKVFDRVKSIIGISDWPVSLIEQRTLPRELSERGPMLEHSNSAAGTFSYEGHQGYVTYDPNLIKDGIGLITVFAHELAHYFNWEFYESVPGGEELYEPATDLTSAFLGFGLLGLGWRQYRVSGDYMTWGGGYFTEEEWIFSTAMFCALSGQEISPAKEFIKSGTWKLLVKALRYIQKEGLAEQIKQNSN